MSISKCMSVVGRLADADQNALLERIEKLQTEEGVGPNKAAVEVATEMLAELERQSFAEPVRSVRRDVTETDEFKEWFGGSKVVDADGKPLVVYHGTVVRPDTDRVKSMGDIKAFDRMFTTQFRRPSIDTVGSWFSTNPGEGGAEMYSGSGHGSAIYPVYLSIQNPQITTFQLMTRRARLLHNGKDDGRPIGAEEVAAYRKWLADTGKDGIKIEGSGNDGSTEFDKQDAWIALEPEQIKSATGNRGTFDPADPDITRSAARPEFFSQLQRAIEQVPDRLATMAAPQWKLWLDANASKLGVKKDEVEWSGVRDYLDLRGKEKVSRDELAAFLGDNGVRVEETVLGEDEGLTNEERTELSELRDLRRRHEGGERGVLDPSDVRRLRELEFRSTRPAGSTPKYSQYTVPGGDNYREVLITLPGDKPQQGWTASSMIDRKDELVDGDTVDDLAFNTAVAQVRESGGMSAASEALSKKISSTSGKKSHVSARNLINELIRQNAEIAKARSNQKPTYKSNHWDQPNILAHLRVDDRTDADGKRVLFINEIQSDWGQDGKKKGFRAGKPVIVAKKIGKSRWFPEQDEYDVTVDGETRPRMSGASESEVISRVAETLPAFAAAGGKSKVPSAPFVTDTKAWAGLALKRAIMMAVESGYDRVALITGQQAADLYDLSKRVSEIRYEKVDDKDLWEIEVDDSEGNQIMSEDEIPASRIEELVGKEIAQKIVAGDGEAFTPDSPRDWRRLTGLDLKVGGEGMRAFYDQIIPQVARDVLKKLGGDGLKKTTITEDPNVALDKWEAEDGEGDGSRAPTTESQNLAFDITPAMREKVAAGVPLFSKRRQDPIESAENFKRWSNNAPLITSAAADDHAFRTGQKVVLEAYHGTARGDRVGDVFQRSRATSGPMAFFTSDPELASSYATGKRDTSLSDEELQYTGWFKYKAPGMRSSVSIDRAWSLLPNDVRERIAQRMPDIRTDDNDQIVYEEGGGDIGSYEWNLQQTRRGYLGANPLAAAAETWLNSGTLFGEEERFMEVLRLAGMPMGDTQYDSPNDSFPFVYKAFVFMQNPLATGDIPESFDQALRQAAAKDRSRARYENGVDSWDKNTRTLRAWADEYFNPASGDNRFVWTSIPDKVSDLIKSLGYDGIIDYSGKGGGTVHPVYIPTEENQVKSAIGNNGKYSTARSILRSAGRAARFHRDMDTVKLAGGYTLGDMMKSSKKVSWWDKSVGSMFNLAEKQPQFKRVYDEVQSFLGDISKYATRAADMAPTIIPKLETLSDIARRPLSVEDTKALSAPVFEGTLMYRRDEEGNPVRTDDVGAAGVVWREDELRTMYGLNDSQIALYRETRKSINKSLTDLSITDMLRYAGKDADGVRSAVLSSTTANQAAQILAQEFERLAEQTPERRSALEDSARGVKEKANLTQGLIAKGYAPLSRYGDYTVYVTKDGGAEQVFFGMYETEREANKAARAWRDAEPDAQVATGTMSKESYKLFKGVTPETLALFGESLGLEEGASDRDSQVFQAYLKAAKTNRSAMKRMIERKGVAGYSEDVGRVLAGFVYSNARQASTNLHAGQIAKAAADIKDGDLKDQAIKLVEYTQTPKNEANALRGLMFANFIGGSIASALVNTTQTATTTLPALAMHFGTAKAASGLAKAIDNVRKLSLIHISEPTRRVVSRMPSSA